MTTLDQTPKIKCMMEDVPCFMLCVLCSVFCVPFSLFCVECSVLHDLSSTFCVLCSMFRVMYSTFCVPCSMLSVLCSTFSICYFPYRSYTSMFPSYNSDHEPKCPVLNTLNQDYIAHAGSIFHSDRIGNTGFIHKI